MVPDPDSPDPFPFARLDRYRDTISETGLSIRMLAFVTSFACLAAAYAYDSLYIEGYTVAELGWTADGIDWLFLLTVLLLGFFVVEPLVRHRARTRYYWRQFRRDPLAVAALAYLGTFVVLGSVGPLLVGEPRLDLYHRFQPPLFVTIAEEHVLECAGSLVDGRCHGSLRYPFGTDQNGYDLIRVVVSGMRVSLYVAAITTAIVVPVATSVGVVAGYYGGWIDEALMRYVDVQAAVPAFVVYLVAMPLYGDSLLVIVVVFGLLSWDGPARLVRSETLQRRDEEYVVAARSAGATDYQVIGYHVLPNVSSTVLTAVTHQVPKLLLAEAALSFLQLTSMDTLSFGTVIAYGLGSEWAPYPAKWWVAAVPAAFLAITIASFEYVGDAVRDAYDARDG